MNDIDYYDNLLNNLKVVRILQRKIYMNLPIDSSFGNRLIKNLQNVLGEKLHEIQIFVDKLPDDHVEKHQLRTKVNALFESSENKFEEITEYEVSSSGASSKSTTPLPEKYRLGQGQTMGIFNCVSKIINFHTAYRRIGEEEKGKFVVSCYSKKTYLIDRVCFFFHWDPTQIYTIKILKIFPSLQVSN